MDMDIVIQFLLAIFHGSIFSLFWTFAHLAWEKKYMWISACSSGKKVISPSSAYGTGVLLFGMRS